MLHCGMRRAQVRAFSLSANVILSGAKNLKSIAQAVLLLWISHRKLLGVTWLVAFGWFLDDNEKALGPVRPHVDTGYRFS